MKSFKNFATYLGYPSFIRIKTPVLLGLLERQLEIEKLEDALPVNSSI